MVEPHYGIQTFLCGLIKEYDSSGLNTDNLALCNNVTESFTVKVIYYIFCLP